MQLFLVRHGESEWNRRHLFQGWRHSKLTTTGKKQARKVAKWIARKCQPDLLLSSDLHRAVQTAKIIGKSMHLTPKFTSLLRERKLGSVEGQSSYGKEKQLDHYIEAGKSWIPRDAEKLAAVKKRAQRIIARIKKSRKHCVVIVSHEAFNSVVVNALLRRKLQPVPQNHLQVHWFEIEKRKVKRYIG